MKFRLLRADEIDARISICNEKGIVLLLYKDARCDQNILDETVTPMNWQRHHSRDNANCIVSIWDEQKKQWIEKEDTGTESFTEKEKGLASDSFKRACFNWGIGRELYTAPFMFVNKKDLQTLEEVQQGNFKKWTCKDSFKVIDIQYIDEKIVYVKVLNLKTSKEIEFGTPAKALTENKKIENSYIDEVKVKALKKRCERMNVPTENILNHFGINSIEELNEKQYSETNLILNKKEKKQ
jgi:hypothetical protein